MRVIDPSAPERARGVRLLLFDADGVMTDGRLVFTPGGEEWKFFDSKDGLGLRIARDAGILTGVITGRRSLALERRAQELRFEEVHQGVVDKGRVFEAVLARRGIPAAAVAFVGDDLVDAAPMRKAGLAVATPEAAEDLLRLAHLQTERPGGRGALRETVEYLLRAQGLWSGVLERYGAA